MEPVRFYFFRHASDRNSPDSAEVRGAEELAIVLSHYDIGIIDSIAEFPRGSRKAPKLLIVQRSWEIPAQAPRTREG